MYMDKGFIQIHKNFYKSRKGQNTNRKMDKIFEQTFTEDEVKWPISL